ncbi:MAG: NAD(P)-dependent oxidoreductase [Tissierellia bacterium]|nr:NAD(P)-dependent oxidoreductase [Tissierellia bacterium]
MKILANDGMDKNAVAYFEKQGIPVNLEHYDKETLKIEGPKYDIIIVRSKTKVTKDVIDALKQGRTKLIIRAGVGLDNIDLPYCAECGISVRNTPNSSKHSVAELVLGQMLNMARYINRADYSMKEGQWKKKELKGFEIRNKTLGIIGYGRIGKCLAEKAKALGMEVLCYDPFCHQDANAKKIELEDLFRRSDFVSVHTPSLSTPIITEETLKLMEGGYLINYSRGNAVDEEALIQALRDGVIAGAALDVFRNEPNVNQEFFTMDNVTLTPHIGAATEEAQQNIGQEIIEVIEDYTRTLQEVAG